MNRKPIVLSIVILALCGSATQAAELCGGPLSDNNFDRPLDYTSNEDKYGCLTGEELDMLLMLTK